MISVTFLLCILQKKKLGIHLGKKKQFFPRVKKLLRVHFSRRVFLIHCIRDHVVIDVILSHEKVNITKNGVLNGAIHVAYNEQNTRIYM